MNCAGAHGEWEQNSLQDHRMHLQWEELDQDLSLAIDSVPENVWQETLNKAWGLLKAIELAEEQSQYEHV